MLFLRSAIRKMSSLPRENILVLFDVDGTLTPARKTISPEFEEFLYTKIKPKATIGIVGGSDLEKMSEQLNGKRILDEFDYVFPENGLVQIEKGVEVGKVSIQKHLGEEVLQDFLNYALKYLSELKIPVKRGTFIDYRNGMINVSPIGRQCSYEERLAFNKYDDENLVRLKMIEDFKKRFHNVDLTYSIGGQISIDVFPHGWDKTFCLRHATKGTKYVHAIIPNNLLIIILSLILVTKKFISLEIKQKLEAMIMKSSQILVLLVIK